MRFIGSILDATTATRFGDYLTTLGVPNTVEQGSGGFSVWVHDDDHLDRARGEIEAFNIAPDAPKYGNAVDVARKFRQAQEQREKRMRANYVDYRTAGIKQQMRPMPLTIILITICGIVGAATKLGDQMGATGEWLAFGTITERQQTEALGRRIVREVRNSRGFERKGYDFDPTPPGIEQIKRGQVWRLFTPMFLHFGFMHLAFNMLWMVDLGGIIERRRGTWILLGLVLITSLVGNVIQFYWNGPAFGGMSGVVYGLLGYVWMKSRFEPQLGMHLHKNTIMFMMFWLVACIAGLIPNVGNGAHIGGLLAGLVLGHAPYSWRKMRRAWKT